MFLSALQEAASKKGGSVWSRLGDLRDRVRVWSRTDTYR